eukprot:15437852-Alexandrium_andersonii.AAC.1
MCSKTVVMATTGMARTLWVQPLDVFCTAVANGSPQLRPLCSSERSARAASGHPSPRTSPLRARCPAS